MVFLGLGNDGELTIVDGDSGAAIEKLGSNVLVVIERVLGLNVDIVGTTGSSWVYRENALELRLGGVVPRGNVGRGHNNQVSLEQRPGNRCFNER